MTHTEATRLLDAARDGANVPMLEIWRALVETGDAQAFFESFSVDVQALSLADYPHGLIAERWAA